MVKISDLFFCFLRKKSDSFRTVGRYFCPKKPSESPEKWGFQDENKIASSRPRGKMWLYKWLFISHLNHITKGGTIGRSDSFRTVADHSKNRNLFNLTRFKIRNG